MDPEELQKNVNVLVSAINKPNNTTAIKEIIDSIKETFERKTVMEINTALYNTEDAKIKDKTNLEYALKNLQLAYKSKPNIDSDEEGISGGKRRTKRRKTKRRKTKRRRTKRRKY
jgi:hypothetical protein